MNAPRACRLVVCLAPAGPQESPAVSCDTEPFVRVRRTGSTLIDQDPRLVETGGERAKVRPHAVWTTFRTLGEIQYLALVMYADTIVRNPGLRISQQALVLMQSRRLQAVDSCIKAQARLSGCEQQIMTL